MSIDRFIERFKNLRVNRSGDHLSPHKPCMLLTLIDLIEAGIIVKNHVNFDDILLTRYAEYFKVVQTEGDHPNPWMPFFHLRSDGFWKLVPRAGRESILQALKTAVRKGDITENVDHVRLDDWLYQCLSSTTERDQLREILLLHWFPDHADALSRLFGVTAFEKMLRAGKAEEVKEELPARSAAFRRLVLEAYDFRCAASGWRLVLPEGPVLVEAAHIIPFSETNDDRPQNGIALSPTYYWAMDNNVIAPGPDRKWHVSKVLDSRIPDHQQLCALAGKDLLLPPQGAFKPDRQSLAWRVDRLLQ